jgi:tetratricopeptide (TPR) repeat protein
LYVEALGIDSTEYGATHAEVAQDLFNLGAMLEQCNNYTEALPYLERATRTYEALKDELGKAKSLHFVAMCYSGMHQHAKAAEAALASLASHEHFKGKGDSDTLVHLLNAADSVDAQGDGARAQKLYQQALNAAEKAKEPNNMRIAECNLEMGEFFLRHNDRDKAEQYFKTAMVHYETLGKKDRRTLYELPMVYAKLLQDAHRDEEADEISKRYIDVFLPTTTAKATVETPAGTEAAPAAAPPASEEGAPKDAP